VHEEIEIMSINNLFYLRQVLDIYKEDAVKMFCN
jgi:hypothetical protein